MRSFPRVGLALALLCLLPFVSSCSSGAVAVTNIINNNPKWVVGWGAVPENALTTAENPGGSDQTLRMFFYPTATGSAERLRFSNFFGTTPITIGAARIAFALTTPAIDAAHDLPVTFNGATTITLAPGQVVTSDSFNMNVTPGQRMAVTMYVKGTFPSLTQHDSQVNLSYSTPSGAGDRTSDSAGTSLTQSVQEYFLLTAMDLYGPYNGTVALFGSSTIDGHASNYGDTQSYPTSNAAIVSQDNDRPSDYLGRSLAAAGYSAGVLNAGVLGDTAAETADTVPGAGVTAGVNRIDRDVLQQPGITTVIVYLGAVDIRNNLCGNAAPVEDALTSITAQAHAKGVRVILATVPPGVYCSISTSPNYGPSPVGGAAFDGDINPGPENPASIQRKMLNTWVRTVGSTLPGVVAIADLDSVLKGSTHPDFLIPNLNSGDNYHPNTTGYGVQNSAIPISAITAP